MGGGAVNRFFHDVIEPTVQALPVLRVVHCETHNGQSFEIAQTIQRNVYTAFDQALSRYLAATSGAAFPVFTVSVVVSTGAGADDAHRLVSGFHDSVPHALSELAERAFTRAGPVELSFFRSGLGAGRTPAAAQRRRITRHEIDMTRTALGICRTIGDSEFLDVSGDFGMVVARPPGNLDPIIMQLDKGTVLVPSSTLPGSPAFQWSLFSFFERVATNPAAQSYMAGVSQALMAEREGAIMAFRALAERRILDFHKIVGGRPLQGHWLSAAEGLLARLKAGLGDDLTGLAEDARGIALDLSATIEGLCAGEPPREAVVGPSVAYS
ncbi:MAG: hypothetical protein GTN90_11080 [Xanthomonadales bacterium]|nr:hypothetical protein [Xanthomonadales bacterium]